MNLLLSTVYDSRFRLIHAFVLCFSNSTQPYIGSATLPLTAGNVNDDASDNASNTAYPSVAVVASVLLLFCLA